jgi:hypothetical protein
MKSQPEPSELVTKGRNNGTEIADMNNRLLKVVQNRYERNNVEGNRSVLHTRLQQCYGQTNC